MASILSQSAVTYSLVSGQRTKASASRRGSGNKPARFTVRAQEQSASGAPVTSASVDPDKEDLAAKLAAAEAEAAALRKELEVRKAEADGRLSKLKPNSDVFIDGTGFRETIFEGPKLTGKSAKTGGGRSWGFTETELLLSKGSPTEGAGLQSDDEGSLSDDEASSLVQRRLLLAGAMGAVALPLALWEIPVLLTPPVKPLFVYLSPLLRLKAGLEELLADQDKLDIFSLRQQLKFIIGSINSVKDYLLNAAELLDPEYQETGKKLAFEIVDYLEQADFNNYFENVGASSTSLQLEYLKFSIKAIQTARFKLLDFFSLVPPEAMAQAQQVMEASRKTESPVGEE